MPICCWPCRSRKSRSLPSRSNTPIQSPAKGGKPSKPGKPPIIKVSEAPEYGNGNPRNKCALQPGHSLMDWIRYGNSGIDLSGTGGRIIPVTPKELEQHNQIGNAWIAIKGRVYNVTEYMDYHPGGPDELMRGVGKDATKLFDQIHAWVNYESLLSKCLVGPLKHPDMDEEEFHKIMFGDGKTTPKRGSGIPDLLRKSMENLKGGKSKTDDKDGHEAELTNKSSSESSLNNVNESKSSDKSTSSNSTVKVADITVNVKDGVSKSSDVSATKFKFPKLTLTEAGKSDSTESKKVEQSPKNVAPKFDWIQKTDSITLIFYTKALSNALCSVELMKEPSLTFVIKLSYDMNIYQFDVVLEQAVKWPCTLNINYETGKYEIVLNKETPKIWNSYGTIKIMNAVEQTILIDENSFLEYTVVDKVNVTHNTSLIVLKCIKDEFITFPIGYHSRVFFNVEELLSRAYTPVPGYLVPQHKPSKWTPDMICLMVKKYDQGEASTWLTSRNTDDHISMSRPLGTFPLKAVQDATQFCLVAAGTGLTPMLQVVQFALQKRNPRWLVSNWQEIFEKYSLPPSIAQDMVTIPKNDHNHLLDIITLRYYGDLQDNSHRCLFVMKIFVYKRVDLLFFNRAEKDILWHDQLSVLASKDERFHLINTLSTPTSSWEGQRGHINQAFLINYFIKMYKDELNITDTTPSSPTKTAIDNLLKMLHKELYVCICGPTAFTKLVNTLFIGLGAHDEQIHCFLG